MNVWTSARIRLVVAAATVGCLMAPDASAQYFGRNKVQYKDLDFQILKTEHFDIYFYPSARESVDIAARMAERWHARLQKVLGHELRGRQPLVLYASHPDFEQTNAIQGEIGEGTGGVTESIASADRAPDGRSAGRHRSRDRPRAGPRLPVRHHHKARRGARAKPAPITCRCGSSRAWPSTSRSVRSTRTPRCGCATRRGRRRCRTSTTSTTRSTSRTAGARRSGRTSAGRWGDEVVGTMLSTAGNTGDFEVAIQRILGVDSKQLSEQWHQSIRDTYRDDSQCVAAAHRSRARRPEGRGRARRRPERRSGDQPRRQVDRVPVGADRVLDRSVHRRRGERTRAAQADQHRHRPALLEPAVHLFRRRLGRDEPADRDRHGDRRPRRRSRSSTRRADDKEHEYPIAQVDEIFNPTWAPDGNAIAFTGMSRGLTDLWVIDLASGQAAPADQRSVRRSAAGVVARRPPDRVRDRPLLVASRHARHRQLPAGADRSGGRTARGDRRVHARQEHQPAVGGGLRGRSSSSRIATAFRTCTASRSTATLTQLTDIATGHQRHRRVEPGALGRDAQPAPRRSASTTTASIT